MRYTAKEVLEILIERLSRDIGVLESQIKERQKDNPTTVPALIAVHNSFIGTREATVTCLNNLSEN